MTKNNKNPRFSKADEINLIDRVKKEIFECDNTDYREIVDKLMDTTGETAAEIASALVGMLIKKQRPTTTHTKSSSVESKKAVEQNKAAPQKSKRVATTPPKTKAVKSPIKKQASGSVQLMINAGQNKKITHKDIMGALIAQTGVNAADIIKIKVNEKQSVLHVPQQHAKKILSAMNSPNGKIKGIPVKMQMLDKRKKATKNALEK